MDYGPYKKNEKEVHYLIYARNIYSLSSGKYLGYVITYLPEDEFINKEEDSPISGIYILDSEKNIMISTGKEHIGLNIDALMDSEKVDRVNTCR